MFSRVFLRVIMDKITSKSNEKIKLAAALSSSSRERRRRGLFFVEGVRLCRDAAQSGITIKDAFFTEEAFAKHPETVSIIAEKAEYVCLIDARLCAKLSDVKSPQGVFCVCKMLDKTKSCNKIDEKGKYISLDNVQSPDNLGAISRSAEAFGLSGLIISSGCDVYNPKAQRAAMGSLLRLPVFETSSLPRLLSEASLKGMLTAAAVPDASAQSVFALSTDGGVICVTGNEGAGVSQEVADACDISVTIPMRGGAESLNAAAAAAVLMWEMTRNG